MIKIEHINAQSVQGHIDEIRLMVHDRDIDILCISESWLLPVIHDNYINIPKYNVFRYDVGRGGGVCVYIRNCLKVSVINLSLPKVENVDILWLNVQSSKFPSFIIGTVYRHPHAHVNSFDYIEESFREIVIKNKPVFILGDINDDLLCRNAKLHAIFKNCSLNQLITKPTRITPTSSSLIDVLATNSVKMVITSDVEPCPVADHELITLTINVRREKPQIVHKTFRSLKNYSCESFCDDILCKTSELNKILGSDDVDYQVEIVTKTLRDSIDSSAPEVTVAVTRPPAPWLDQSIKLAIAERDSLHRQLKENNNDVALRTSYKEKKKSVKLEMDKCKAEYFQNEFKKCRHNIKQSWKITKSLIPDKKCQIDQCNFDSIDDKAEEFNSYFSNVGKEAFNKTQASVRRINNGSIENIGIPIRNNTDNLFRPQPVTVETIILIVKDLRKTNAKGIDDISLRFVQDSLPIMAFYYTIIVNTSRVQ